MKIEFFFCQTEILQGLNPPQSRVFVRLEKVNEIEQTNLPRRIHFDDVGHQIIKILEIRGLVARDGGSKLLDFAEGGNDLICACATAF